MEVERHVAKLNRRKTIKLDKLFPVFSFARTQSVRERDKEKFCFSSQTNFVSNHIEPNSHKISFFFWGFSWPWMGWKAQRKLFFSALFICRHPLWFVVFSHIHKTLQWWRRNLFLNFRFDKLRKAERKKGERERKGRGKDKKISMLTLRQRAKSFSYIKFLGRRFTLWKMFAESFTLILGMIIKICKQFQEHFVPKCSTYSPKPNRKKFRASRRQIFSIHLILMGTITLGEPKWS